jgi:hypothetical protein
VDQVSTFGFHLRSLRVGIVSTSLKAVDVRREFLHRLRPLGSDWFLLRHNWGLLHLGYFPGAQSKRAAVHGYGGIDSLGRRGDRVEAWRPLHRRADSRICVLQRLIDLCVVRGVIARCARGNVFSSGHLVSLRKLRGRSVHNRMLRNSGDGRTLGR